MVSVISSGAVDRGFEPGQVTPSRATLPFVCFFQYANTIKSQVSVLVQYKADITIISLNVIVLGVI